MQRSGNEAGGVAPQERFMRADVTGLIRDKTQTGQAAAAPMGVEIIKIQEPELSR